MSSRNCIKNRPSCSKIAKATNIISYQFFSYRETGDSETGVGRQESGVGRQEIILIFSPLPHTPHPTPQHSNTPHPHTPHPTP
ncbi:MAG: hypothetical protein GPJ13_19020, partial [Microcystis aeruginosa W11-06]|nr:hypothetical protein [Microcystis aeruginosa W11-06]